MAAGWYRLRSGGLYFGTLPPGAQPADPPGMQAAPAPVVVGPSEQPVDPGDSDVEDVPAESDQDAKPARRRQPKPKDDTEA